MRQLFSATGSRSPRRPATVLAVLLVTVAGASAQTGIISGQVYESGEGGAVGYANVVLYRSDDSVQVTGAMTDAQGGFVLSGVGAGSHYLEVSFVGYRTRRVTDIELASGARLELGRLALEPMPVAVEGAEAVGEKPTMRYEVDKKVLEVSKMPGVQSGSAVDALENAPAVTVDIEGNVSLRGSQNFTLLVDGRPTLLEPSDALRQIPASTVDRIEIITNPSAKYDPDGVAGIINVLLKKQRATGVSSLANANGGLDGAYGGDILLGYKQGAVNAHAGGNYNRYRFAGSRVYENRTFQDEDTLFVSGDGQNAWAPRFGGGRAGAELQLGPRDRTSLSGRYGLSSLRNSFGSEVVERYVPGDSVRRYATDGGWERAGDYYYLLGDYQHEFDTAGHKVVASVSYGGRSGLDRLTSVHVEGGTDTTTGRRTEEEGPTGFLRAELEYELPVRDGDKLEAGYESRFERADQDYRLYWYDSGDYAQDTSASHPYGGERNIHSAYATYNWTVRKFSVQAGLRGEYGQRLVVVKDLGNRYEIRRWDAFPTLHASLGLPAGQVMASYSRRIQRPWPWLLRPFPTWTDERNIMQGNPELRPEYTNAFEAGYQLPFGPNMLSLEGYYRASNDVFEWATSPWPQNPDVLVMKAENVGTQRSTGGELMLNLTPLRWWTVNLTGNLYDFRVQGELNGQSFAEGSFNYDGRLGSDFRLPFGSRLSVNVYYSSPSVSAQGRNRGYFRTDAAVQQSLFNRALSVTLRVQDLLGTGEWSQSSAGPGFSNEYEFSGRSRVVSLALRYNFNNFRLDPKLREGEGMETQGAPQM